MLGLQQDLTLSVLAVQLVSAAVPCGVAHRAAERKAGSGCAQTPYSVVAGCAQSPAVFKLLLVALPKLILSFFLPSQRRRSCI